MDDFIIIYGIASILRKLQLGPMTASNRGDDPALVGGLFRMIL